MRKRKSIISVFIIFVTVLSTLMGCTIGGKKEPVIEKVGPNEAWVEVYNDRLLPVEVLFEAKNCRKPHLDRTNVCSYYKLYPRIMAGMLYTKETTSTETSNEGITNQEMPWEIEVIVGKKTYRIPVEPNTTKRWKVTEIIKNK
jgi:hypothetical protein